MRLPKPKLAESLAELVPEKTVKSVWELDHNTSFQNAIKEAAGASYPDVDQCFKTFQAILRAIETAYLVNTWGWEFLHKPKINILHKGLRDIADAAGIGLGKELTEKGFATFLDDLCPCGLKRHESALRRALHRSRLSPNNQHRPKQR